MHSQIRRTQKTKSDHKLDKKKSQISKMPNGLKNGDNMVNNTTINYSSSHVKGHTFMPHSYSSQKGNYNWKFRKDVVERAISIAIAHLNKAWDDPIIKDHHIIKNAIEEVIRILDDSELEIYPFFGLSDGLAKKNEKKISIRTTLVVNALRKGVSFDRLTKTLIHEAFHIIGGCVEGKSNDSICEDSVDKNIAFEKIVSKSLTIKSQDLK